MPSADVAVIGAGPAGAWAAWRLARGGARVTILDPSHPREKPCGGGLTRRAAALLHPALDLASLPHVSIGTARFEHGAQRSTVALAPRHDAPALAIVARRDLDGALLDSARAAGATHLARRVRDVRAHRHGWEIVTDGEPLTCRWVVGADGPASLVRRRLSAPFERADLSIATGYFVPGLSAPDVTIAFDDDTAGYLWSFPRPDHLAVGVCAQADAATSQGLLAVARDWIARAVPGHGALQRYAWPIPSLTEAALGRERPSGPGWMLVGDAAGLVDPITREGIYFAVRSADLAADSILSEWNPARCYAEAIRDDIHAELRRAARLKARFFRPSFITLLMRALHASAPIREVMADLVSGEQQYRGLRRRLLGTLELGLMIEMIRTR
ncbi:MAG: geranylgeranyl reductase family protein [Vicinamibacterales bacterium]